MLTETPCAGLLTPPVPQIPSVRSSTRIDGVVDTTDRLAFDAHVGLPCEKNPGDGLVNDALSIVKSSSTLRRVDGRDGCRHRLVECGVLEAEPVCAYPAVGCGRDLRRMPPAVGNGLSGVIRRGRQAHVEFTLRQDVAEELVGCYGLELCLDANGLPVCLDDGELASADG